MLLSCTAVHSFMMLVSYHVVRYYDEIHCSVLDYLCVSSLQNHAPQFAAAVELFSAHFVLCFFCAFCSRPCVLSSLLCSDHRVLYFTRTLSLQNKPFVCRPLTSTLLQPASAATDVDVREMIGRFVMTGSDDTNLRIWKANASEKLGKMVPREARKQEYRESLKKR